MNLDYIEQDFTPTTWEVINDVVNALQRARTLSHDQPSRELSLAITKLEESMHWLQHIVDKGPEKPWPRDKQGRDISEARYPLS